LINTYPRPSHSFIRREIAALEAEVRRLSEENAFLKKAAAFFAKNQK